MKKFFLTVCSVLMMAANASAIPGVKHFFGNVSGEYVYYRDYTFNRESYVGFLTYDESTYAARYFAPAADNLAPINIELIFTIDSTKDYIEMTGERFLTNITQDDTDIINYIHDLVYEFAARRKKIGLISPEVESEGKKNPSVKYKDSSVFIESGFVSHEDYSQFGGEVFIYYDYMIPIFNIKKIMDNANHNVLEVVASGILRSSQDKSFSEFRPFVPVTKKVSPKKNKKAKPLTVTLEKTQNAPETQITIDETWADAGSTIGGMFFHGDDALLVISCLEKGQGYIDVLRSLLHSELTMYTPVSSISIAKEKDRTLFYSDGIDTDNGTVYERIYVMKEKDGYSQILLLNIKKEEFESDRKYYLNILKTWK